MGISGLVAAGAQQGLEAVLERRLRELVRQQQEQHQADQLALQTRQVEGQEADRTANRENQRRTIDLAELRRVDEQANQATQRNASSDMAGVLNMPGMSNDAKANEIMGSGLRTGMVDPAKVIEGLTRIQPRTPTRTVTVRGPSGGPMEKAFTDEELAQGVDRYVEPLKPEKPARTELTPGQAFSATRQLRNDYTRETASAKTVAQQLALMESSMDAARKGDLAAGSQGVLVTFQKILDPTSVVRESEYARSASGQSLLSRMEGAVTQLQKGGAGVPVEQLQKFADLAKQFKTNQSDFAKTSKKQIDAIAKEYGLNSENITRDFEDATEGADVIQKPIPSIAGGMAESRDGGKTWKRVR